MRRLTHRPWLPGLLALQFAYAPYAAAQSDLTAPLGAGYLQNESALLPQTEVSGTQSHNVRPTSGFDAPEQPSDASATLCQQARVFRDQKLYSLWDAQQRKYAVLTDGSASLVKLRHETATLLDHETWVGSTGASVAIEIKGYTDALNDIIGLFVPETQIMSEAFHHADEIARSVTAIGVLVTYAKDDANAAAHQTLGELWAQYGGQIGAATRLLADAEQYAAQKRDAREYEHTVQSQVQKINDTLRMLDSKRREAVQKMDGYQEVVESIDMICANSALNGTSTVAASPVIPIFPQRSTARANSKSIPPSRNSSPPASCADNHPVSQCTSYSGH
jgi:hypothetical protein